MSASPACTARAARRSAITPEAPPVGMWSSQRGDRPRCWVTPTAVSGASEKLLTVRPSICSLAMPDCFDQRLQRLADEPVRAVRRVAHVGHRHRHGDRDAFVADGAAHQVACRFFMRARVDAVRAAPGSCRASSRSSPRWIFCDGVSGSASTKAT